MSDNKPRVLIVEARFYDDIADHLVNGAQAALQAGDIPFDRITVPGALEIPAAIKFGSKKYDAFVALGCVIRGETSHYDIVAGDSARAIMDLTVQDGLCIGNGILTTENRDQAIVRADPAQKNKGADAVNAALALYTLKQEMGA